MNQRNLQSGESQAGKLREELAHQFTALDRTSNPLTYLAQQFTMSMFGNNTQEHLAQQFTQSAFHRK